MEEELTKSYITMPKGFKANGVPAGMKCADPANINENDPKSSYLDVGMVYSDTLCNVAGVYVEEPGAHEWDFWDRQIKCVLDWLPLQEEDNGLNSGNVKTA